MAIYHQDIIDIELNSGNIFRSFLKHSIGLGDAAANRFGVRVLRDGEPETLSGVTCQGYFQNANGENIALTSYGTISGNEAYVTLPQACYNVEGRFTLAIKLVGGGVTGTMRIVDGAVDNTNTSSPVAPTGSVPTYQEVLSVFEQMQTAVSNYDAKVTEQDGKIDYFKSALLLLPVIKDESFDLEVGGINPSTGSGTTATISCRTISKPSITPYLITVDNPDYVFQVWLYSSGWTVAGNPTNGKRVSGGTIIAMNQSAIQIYYRVEIRRADGATLTTDESDPNSDWSIIKNALRVYSATDKTLTVSDAAADAKVTGEALEALSEDKLTITSVIYLSENDDLDNCETPGVYSALNATIAQTIINAPDGVVSPFTLYVTKTNNASTGIRQILIVTLRNSMPDFYIRTKTTDGWGSWFRYATEVDIANLNEIIGTKLTMDTPDSLSTGDDLDDFTDPGVYSTPNVSIANSIINKPTENLANFTLYVLKSRSNSTAGQFIRQIVMTVATNERPKIWMRVKTSLSFGDWTRFANAEELAQSEYSEVSVSSVRDSNTTIYFTKIPKQNADGTVNRLFVACGEIEFSGGEPVSCERFTTTALASDEHSSMAMNGGFFALQGGTMVPHGGVIRDGVILLDRPYQNTHNEYALGIYANGEFGYYKSDEFDGITMLREGVVQAFCGVGPIITNGAIDTAKISAYNLNTNGARNVVGYDAEGNYIILTCSAEITDEAGITPTRAAELLIAEGAIEAYMMDGGGSVSTTVNGTKINHNMDSSGTSDRPVSTALYVQKVDKQSVTNANLQMAILQSAG